MDSLRRNYQKFRQHLEAGGLLYSFWRGIKYLRFLVAGNRGLAKAPPLAEKKMIRLACSRQGLNISYNNEPLTTGVGLNMAINTVSGWTDSSRAEWQVLSQSEDYIKVKIIFQELPLALFWDLKIVDQRRIDWQAYIRAEEFLVIDELRLVCLLNPHYKSWFTENKFMDFPQFTGSWQNLYFLDQPSSLVGAGKGGSTLPDFTLEGIAGNTRPFIQNTPKKAHSRCIGFRILEPGEYPRGNYLIFQGRIVLGGNDPALQKQAGQLAGKLTSPKPKVLLVNLPWKKDGRWGVRAGSRWPHIKDETEEGNYLPFPFFLAYAASLLKKHNFTACLIDALADKIGEEELLRRIKVTSPDLLLVETSIPSLNHDLELLKRIGNKDFKICLCGPVFNLQGPDFLKEYEFIDYILIGEYEYSLLDLARAIAGKIEFQQVQGLVYRQAQEVKMNPCGPLVDLDSLPWPLREQLPMEKYCDTPGAIPLPSAQMTASRGCPFGCSFCLWPQVMYHGNQYRTRKLGDVVDEMEYLVKEMGFKSVYFDDDTFNIGKERMLEFCRLLIDRGLNRIPWAIMARPDLMDEEMLTRMKEAGLAAIKYGVESSSQELLDKCGKNMDLQKAEKMILLTNDLGIKTHLTFTFGLPGETKQSIDQTIKFALKLKPYSVQFSITTPFPGTRYFNELDSQGLIVNKNWNEYDGNFKSVIRLEHLSQETLEFSRSRAYKIWAKADINRNNFRRLQHKFFAYRKQGGLGLSFHKTFHYLKRKKINYLLDKLKGDYLNILGILNGSRAFKGPDMLQIDLTDHCNNNCIACWCNSPLLSRERLAKPKYILPKDLAKGVIAEARDLGLKEIFFSGGGEPFMHPDILDIIAYAKKKDISCTVNTNFTLVDKDTIGRLIDLGLDNLTVSAWSGTAKVYKLMHPNRSEEDFYKLRERLTELNSRKDIYPRVKVYNVICSLNYDQVKPILDFVEQTKSDFVEFTVADTIPGATDKLLLSDEQREAILEQFSRIKQDAQKIINREHFLRRVSNCDARQAEYDSRFIDSLPCYVGWLFARVMPNGDINSCLKSHRFPIGNLHQEPFKAIWNSHKQVYFRNKTRSMDKQDPFFKLIGNDPESRIGCYKSCDNIARNIEMHRKLGSLTVYDKFILKLLSRLEVFNRV
ncbi:MAG: radical SAM protein [Candidatus Omnitrophica bacterium]|nr:radical SAM protein [Candidatus Omnitrophota bacterium]